MRFFYNNIVVLLPFKTTVCNISNDNEPSVEQVTCNQSKQCSYDDKHSHSSHSGR